MSPICLCCLATIFFFFFLPFSRWGEPLFSQSSFYNFYDLDLLLLCQILLNFCEDPASFCIQTINADHCFWSTNSPRPGLCFGCGIRIPRLKFEAPYADSILGFFLQLEKLTTNGQYGNIYLDKEIYRPKGDILPSNADVWHVCVKPANGSENSNGVLVNVY